MLRLIAAGRTAKEAARELAIAPKTADNHIQSLYSKIGVSTRAGAALYALERGLAQQGIRGIGNPPHARAGAAGILSHMNRATGPRRMKRRTP